MISSEIPKQLMYFIELNDFVQKYEIGIQWRLLNKNIYLSNC